jgi:hypothetical protein
VVGLFALLLVVIGAFQAVKVIGLETAGARATGAVVRLAEDEDSDGNTTYFPVVRFPAADGRTVEFRDSVGSNPPGQQAGDTVNVLYPADDPGGAIIDRGAFWNGAIPALLLLAGGFLAWLFVVIRRSRAASGGSAVARGAAAPAAAPAAVPDTRHA